MNQREKKDAKSPGRLRIFCLSMAVAFAGLTGCGRQELEFYTEEELAEASGTRTQDGDTAGEESQNVEAAGSQASVSEPAKIFVDVCGAVANPGVYELAADSRVFQAIELAGGYLPEAAQSYLNRADFLADGQQIYVPTQAQVDENAEKFSGEAAAFVSGGITETQSGQTDEAASDNEKVNLNTADLSELTTLTGIGESKAQAIIAYREANGAFQTIEDLMKVDGIKEGTFAKISDRITVG